MFCRKRQIIPPKRNCQAPIKKLGKGSKICPLHVLCRGTHPRQLQWHPGMLRPSSRSSWNRCVQSCPQTSGTGVDVLVQIPGNTRSHNRNNPYQSPGGSCRHWQNRLHNSPEKRSAFEFHRSKLPLTWYKQYTLLWHSRGADFVQLPVIQIRMICRHKQPSQILIRIQPILNGCLDQAEHDCAAGDTLGR